MNIDFSFWLLVLTIASGIITVIDKYKYENKRLAGANKQLKVMLKKERKKFIYKSKTLRPPFIADYSRSLFSIFFIIFIFRGFLIGNFFIPSASMMPTLPIGSFILVNKSAYGIRNPITNEMWISLGKPRRGDIVVFKFPVNPKIDFIKRIIGLPGDVISYKNKQLSINGLIIKKTGCKVHNVRHHSTDTVSLTCYEYLNDKLHETSIISTQSSTDFMELSVPKGMYFVMGDNRDNSHDSRYWGFVKDEEIIGQANIIWFSWDNLNYSVRWHEIGKILS